MASSEPSSRAGHRPGHAPRPNLFIAGGIRCGTTWLHAALAEHPDVCISPIEKEIGFFDCHFDRGEDWYKSFFPARTTARWVVDASPSYLDAEHVPQRLHDFEPDARLIFILRDPVQRAYSHYCRLLNAGNATFEIAAELTPESECVRHGFYFRHLEEYRRRFPDRQILVLLYDDLERDPRGFLDRVLTFLEISTDHTPANLFVRTNKTKPLKRWPLLHEVLRRGYHGLLYIPLVGPLAFRLRSRNGFDAYHRLNKSVGLDYPPLTPEIHQQLAELYRPDVENLAEWLGRDLSDWLTVAEATLV